MIQKKRFQIIDYLDGGAALYQMLAHQGSRLVDQFGAIQHRVGCAQTLDRLDHALLRRSRQFQRRPRYRCNLGHNARKQEFGVIEEARAPGFGQCPKQVKQTPFIRRHYMKLLGMA